MINNPQSTAGSHTNKSKKKKKSYFLTIAPGLLLVPRRGFKDYL